MISWLAVASCVEAAAMVATRSMPGDTLCTMASSLRRYLCTEFGGHLLSCIEEMQN